MLLELDHLVRCHTIWWSEGDTFLSPRVEVDGVVADVSRVLGFMRKISTDRGEFSFEAFHVHNLRWCQWGIEVLSCLIGVYLV